ncbi:hypothetical protein KR026_006666 [Drosophila bipectinata]|nr:hypothetical protein KR026_006666 [Drosophila bipectinata]
MSRPKPALVVLSLWLVVLFHLHPAEARYASSIPDICNQPPPRSDGVGTIEFEGFYYDTVTFDCQKYSIGSRHLKPGQSFGSRQDCVTTCIHGFGRNKDRYVNE